jgi:hypothetical protein
MGFLNSFLDRFRLPKQHATQVQNQNKPVTLDIPNNTSRVTPVEDYPVRPEEIGDHGWCAE